MSRAALAFVVVVVVVAAARDAAADRAGVVATGDAALAAQLTAQLEAWLRAHHHEVVAGALDEPAIGRLVDCFTVDDSSCARKVVEKAATTDSIVFARASREGPSVSVTVHWIAKGKPAVGARRGCEPCSDAAMRDTAGALMASLAIAEGGAPPSRLEPRPSRTVPVLLGIAGVAALAGGGVELYLGQKGGPDEKTIYPTATAAGIALVGTGALAVGAAIWLWRRGASDSHPVAMLAPGGGSLGWQGRF